MSRPRAVCGFVSGVVALLVTVGGAAAADEAREPATITLEAVAGVPGRIAAVEGVTDPDGQLLDFPVIDLFSPAVLYVMGGDADSPLLVEIYGKEDSDDTPSRTARIDTGELELPFRTGGNFRLVLRSEAGAVPYGVALWVGDEVAAEMPAALVEASSYEEAAPRQGQGSTSKDEGSLFPTWFLVALTVFMAGILVLAFRGAKRSGT